MNSRGGGRCRGGGEGARWRWQLLLSNCVALLEHLVYDVCRIAHTTPVSTVIAWVSGSNMQTEVLDKIGKRGEDSIPEREEGGRERGKKDGRRMGERKRGMNGSGGRRRGSKKNEEKQGKM